MPLSASIIQRLAALHLPTKAMSEVLAIVAEVADMKRSSGAERQARYRQRHSNVTSNITESVTERRNESDAPPSLDKEIPQTPQETNPFPKENPHKGGQKKATRIGDFAPNVEAAVSMGLSRKLAEAEGRKFVDYFRSAAREKGVKLDWDATWRNWIRRAMEQLGIPEITAAGSDMMIPKTDSRWEFLAARWERENGKEFPSRAEQWPFPEAWLKDANQREADIPKFLDRRTA